MDKIPFEFEVSGPYALFSDPATRPGGEKSSYMVPTYEAVKNICKSIYWKPTFIYVVDEIRIMEPINFIPKGVRVPKYDKNENDLATYMYLTNVRYQVRAHIEWNENRPEFSQDRNYEKHASILRRSLEKGGRLDVYLGTRECQADVRPCVFGEGRGAYDAVPELQIGMQMHGIIYPDEGYDAETRSHMTICYWTPVMKNGVITFLTPKECKFKHKLKPMKPKIYQQEGTHELS